jgi:polysaccharide export outer membrane protein
MQYEPTQEGQLIDTVDFSPKRQVYRVRPFDNLLISLNSYEGNTTGFINQKQVEGGGNQNINDGFLYVTSYTVGEDGYVQIPVIGALQVVGSTTAEIKDQIDEKLKSYVKLPESRVRLANFRVTVLGEVNKPGSVFVYDSKLTLPDALGLAGDITYFADAKQVKVVRETEAGLRTGYVDLTDPNFLSSEFYVIYPDDMIYVAPTKARPFHENVKVFSLILSGLSVTALIANLFVK